VINISGPILKNDSLAMLRPWSYHEGDEQYPNEPGEWMNEIVLATLPDANWNAFNDWLEKADSLEMLLHPPQLVEETVAKSTGEPVAVDDDIIGDDSKATEMPVPSGPKQKKKPERKVQLPEKKARPDKRKPSATKDNLPQKITHKNGKVELFSEFKARLESEGRWVEKPKGDAPRKARNVGRR